eukprot:7559629-Pyramimonas_sp.AAC.1
MDRERQRERERERKREKARRKGAGGEGGKGQKGRSIIADERDSKVGDFREDQENWGEGHTWLHWTGATKGSNGAAEDTSD